MTIEQRKIELINWITSLQNESYLLRMEELRQDSLSDVPSEIRELLELSSKTPDKDLIKHTSVKDFLK